MIETIENEKISYLFVWWRL